MSKTSRLAFVLLLVSALFFGGGIKAAEAGNPEPSTVEIETGKKLCGMLDFTQPGLEKIKALADAGKYGEALDVWRDLAVQRLRESNQGPFGWHDNQIAAAQLHLADELAGHSREDSTSGHSLSGFVDYFNISGPPGQERKIDWLAKDPKGQYPTTYQNLYFTISLAADYWKTGDPVYLQKWFEIVSDFARNQKREVDALPPGEKAGLPCNWSQGAQSTLSEGDRLGVTIRCLAVLAKSLPEGGKPADWNAIATPLPAPVPPESLKLVPAVPLAQIVFSMVEDYPPSLEKRYLAAGAVPNQRRNGLTSLLMLSVEFPDFIAGEDVRQKTVAAFQDYLNSAVQIDGGMLEQSFNYNLGDAGNLENLAILIQKPLPQLAALMTDKMILFRRAMAALAMPFGGLPEVGNNHPEIPPAFWANPAQVAVRDAKLAANFAADSNPISRNDPLVSQVNRITSGQPGATVPAFTSVALPYSGYYAQRRDWSLESPYLFFTDSRPSRGHGFHGINGVQVAAYGRSLLVASGPPPYGPFFLSEAFRPDIDKINEFLGESSSWKANTVVVDGKGQANNAPIALTTEPDPLPGRWSSSSRFDFVEGSYNLGYGISGGSKKAVDVDMSVQHSREVIFVRDPGIWIVTDRMTALPGQDHTYSQLWNFPPHIVQGAKSVNGFDEDQVVCDDKARDIHTADAAGPNIWLYHFGQPSLQYVKLYGQKDPVYRGWFARGIGDLIPAPHVQASWKGAGDSLLVTVLWPVPTGTALPVPATAWHDLSSGATAGFSVTLPDGSGLTYLTADQPAAMHADDLDVTARTLLSLTSKPHAGAGLILGARKIEAESKAIPVPRPDFEFARDGSSLTTVTPIEAPKGFRWAGNGDQIKPDYGSP